MRWKARLVLGAREFGGASDTRLACSAPDSRCCCFATLCPSRSFPPGANVSWAWRFWPSEPGASGPHWPDTGSRSRGHVHGHAAFSVGTLHGAAGSAHLLGILPALALPSDLAAGAYLLLFGTGSVAAMGAFASLVGWIAGPPAVGALGCARESSWVFHRRSPSSLAASGFCEFLDSCSKSSSSARGRRAY